MESILATLRRPPEHPREDLLAALPSRIARGDEEAFRELYDALAPRVLGLSLRILHDRSSAEESVVEVFAQVWRQAARYDAAKGPVASWVGTMARTRAIDLMRIRQRRSGREVEAQPEMAEFLPDPIEGPERAAMDGERANTLRRALSDLPRDQRIAVELAFFGGLSHSEVARTLDAPLGTVKTRIRTGLTTLRMALSTVEDELR